MDEKLRNYAEKLNKKMVNEVVLFTTSNWSRRTVYALKKILKSRGIKVADEYFYAHMLHIKQREEAARAFGKQFMQEGK